MKPLRPGVLLGWYVAEETTQTVTWCLGVAEGQQEAAPEAAAKALALWRDATPWVRTIVLPWTAVRFGGEA